MKWILEHLQLIIGAAAAIAYFLNRRARNGGDEETTTNSPTNLGSDEQAERTRRIQEEILRKRAARRSAPEAEDPQAHRPTIPPLVRPSQIPPIDTFGGPGRQIFRKLERAANESTRPQVDEARVRAQADEITRQARLAEQLRELERARREQERRAADIKAATLVRPALARATSLPSPSARDALRNRGELRRAMILREIVGPPVGLR